MKTKKFFEISYKIVISLTLIVAGAYALMQAIPNQVYLFPVLSLYSSITGVTGILWINGKLNKEFFTEEIPE